MRAHMCDTLLTSFCGWQNLHLWLALPSSWAVNLASQASSGFDTFTLNGVLGAGLACDLMAVAGSTLPQLSFGCRFGSSRTR